MQFQAILNPWRRASVLIIGSTPVKFLRYRFFAREISFFIKFHEFLTKNSIFRLSLILSFLFRFQVKSAPSLTPFTVFYISRKICLCLFPYFRTKTELISLDSIYHKSHHKTHKYTEGYFILENYMLGQTALSAFSRINIFRLIFL